ncbi:endo-1,3-alpha-glucanase family glycosylhydrolase [Pedobacter duraquae]|uniref:Glycosyl hydrolase family 71 n=1 Tax=Pedobacter duraquae TaxID=425511 RepID=A0A4R6IP11_9SPHI|nr:endo-1,3-alpha-glucanase family glycosylhydrolase [Pedobacter duraquae]TDO24002.1 glycosyl hydrolase family 71 [Pedobacter duraquae]
MHRLPKFHSFVALFLLCWLVQEPILHAQDSLKNLPEYSLPLTSEKLVIAHCMTNIISFKGHPLEDSGNSRYYAPTGNISAPLGGLTQVKVMVDSMMSSRSLDEAVEFEMRAAIRSGIDGFQFYYILGAKDWDNIIKAYFRVAEQQKLKFKFTFCISHPNGKTEDLKIEEYAARMNGILDEVGRDNKHWLRTPDGRLVIYQWDGEGLADIPADRNGLPVPYYIARAYQRLADKTHERFACIFTINKEITNRDLNDFLDYFPATWIWTLPYNDKNYVGERISQICSTRKRTFTASVFNDFYTSKLLKKGTWDMYHQVSDAVQAGIGQVERKYITTGLSYNFRKLLEFGIAKNAAIINVITWNDYPEGHHLAPEINHNEGFSILLNYYKSKWKNEPSPYADRDVAIAFFKKYKHDVVPAPFNIPVKAFQKEVIPAVWEDSIELVTLLRAPADINVNGSKKHAAAGLSISKFPMKTGVVSVNVTRNNQRTVKFVTPEGITAFPYRSDRITYTFSSEFERFYKDLYPGFTPSFSTEYNTRKQ